MTALSLNVDLGDRSYPILIQGNGLSGLEGALDTHVQAEKYFIVTDSNVAGHYLARLKSFDIFKEAPAYIIAPGEQSKDIKTYNDICLDFLKQGITRKSCIVAFGGGVVGDLAGFVAATVMRGTGYVQVPTTLLAQVDSSVGGKTGLNTVAGKNLIGSFYQPDLVYADINLLSTLPHRQIIAGYAEVLKYALIDDPAFFDWLDQNAGKILNNDPQAMAKAIETSCRKKADIVAQDEREGGVRALLNLGHTFGHALEALAGYNGSLLHGEAVLIGMDMALAYSVSRGYSTPDDLTALRKHYADYNLWPEWQITATADDILHHMQKDKKNTKDQIVLILMRGIGNAFIAREENTKDIKDFLVQYLKER